MSIPSKKTKLSVALKLGLGLATATTLAGPGAVFAQDEERLVEEVVITGSRIKRADSDSISPITTLTSEDLSVSGNLTLENFVQDLPSVNGGDFGAGVNNGNPGVATVSLRGLGPNRTLVLVNGKRFASAGVDGYVDLNSIPTSIVERIEVLRDGASTVYGTDAVAGVVNIITKKNFEGVEFDYGYDVTDEDDGDMHNFSVTFGNTFERGNFVFAAQVNKRDEIRQGDRSFSACPFFDDGVRTICGGSPTTTPAQFTPLGVDSDIGGQVLDADGVTTRDFDAARDAFNFAALSYLTTPSDTYNAYAAVNYELIEESAFGSIGSSLEMNYSNRTSDQLLAPVGTFGGWITSASHPDNPFGNILCGANPDCTEPQDVATSRRLTESGGRLFTQEVDTWRVSLGFDGEFNNGWTWDANYTIAKWLDSQRDEGRPNRPNIEAMMDPDLCAAAGDCPGVYNPFISNSMTPEQVAYGFVGVNTKDESKLNIFQFNLSGGTGLELPGGEVRWAVGYENRRESASSSPDGGAAIGAIAFTPGNVTGGKFEVDEYYGELVFPILQGAPLAEVLAVEASYRVSDVDFVSGSDSIYKVALEWAPVEDVRFRATFAEGFRAPNISELFLGQQQSAEAYTDPCRNYGSSGTSANTVANCQADGLAPDFNIATFQATTLQGGNPDLEPETSESFTVGLVFTPSFIENLTFSLDYFDIEIENAVGTAPTSEVISSCYASAGFSDPLCALIVGPATPGVDETPSPAAPGRRNSNQQISGVLQTEANLATYNTSGYDFQINYGISTRFGMLDLVASGTYLEEYDYLPFAGGETVELAGFFGGDPAFGNPAAFADWQTNYSATLTQDNWGANISARYMASTEDIDAAPGNLENTADDITYWDAQGYYKWNNMTFTVGVRNLTDEEPPYVTAYDDMNTLQFSYDTQGRYYYARAKVTF
ncbi:MAG: TonB-dependent receptor plug domain-containing protein [Halioglobus sp.]